MSKRDIEREYYDRYDPDSGLPELTPPGGWAYFLIMCGVIIGGFIVYGLWFS